MPSYDETQPIGFPPGFVERLRVHIPPGQNLELDSAVRRCQLARVLQQLEAAKRLTVDPVQIFTLVQQLVIANLVQGFPNKEGIYVLNQVVRAAQLSELYAELHAVLYPPPGATR